MKKIKTFVTMMMFALAGMTLSGCDDDDFREIFEEWGSIDEADKLHGTWEGYLGTYYYDRWGVNGEDYVTTMRFDAPAYGAYSGRGYEVDRPRYGGSSYYCEFSWTIDYNGDIVLRYDDDIYHPVYIYDYYLSNNRFRGYMDDGTNREIKFDFRYVSHFDWGPYYANKPNRSE